MTKVFHFAWLTKTGSCTWKVCSTHGLTKTQLSWANWDAGFWVTELTLLICSWFLLRFNCGEMLWQRLITRHSANFYCDYPQSALSWEFSISIYIENMITWDLLLFMLKTETSTGGTNSMPFLVLRRDHLRSASGIICGSRSFAVQFGDHLRSGIICRAVQYRQFRASSFSSIALNRPSHGTVHLFHPFAERFFV